MGKNKFPTIPPKTDTLVSLPEYGDNSYRQHTSISILKNMLPQYIPELILKNGNKEKNFRNLSLEILRAQDQRLIYQKERKIPYQGKMVRADIAEHNSQGEIVQCFEFKMAANITWVLSGIKKQLLGKYLNQTSDAASLIIFSKKPKINFVKIRERIESNFINFNCLHYSEIIINTIPIHHLVYEFPNPLNNAINMQIDIVYFDNHNLINNLSDNSNLSSNNNLSGNSNISSNNNLSKINNLSGNSNISKMNNISDNYNSLFDDI